MDCLRNCFKKAWMTLLKQFLALNLSIVARHVILPAGDLEPSWLPAKGRAAARIVMDLRFARNSAHKLICFGCER